VSLSGYEAPDDDESTAHEDTQQSQIYEDETVEGDTVTGATATPPRPASSQADFDEETSTIDSPSMAHAHSTPRAPNTEGKEPVFADFSSPYESLRREMTGSRTPKLEPTTPGKTQALPDMTSLLDSSPFAPPTSGKRAPFNQDPLLHRVLDKTYRVQATPLISPRKYKPTGAFTPSTARRGVPIPGNASSALPKWADDSSPPSSPAPQLRADIFSPAKTPRTPGISVQTPGKGKTPFSITRSGANVFDSDSEEDEDEMGFSPPKTIQFHIPQSKLLQTPAREASRRIVEDLLMTAGGDITDTTGGMDEDSPSVVRRQVNMDDSF
jgi:DASH complex subunit ASK1